MQFVTKYAIRHLIRFAYLLQCAISNCLGIFRYESLYLTHYSILLLR